MVEMKKWCTVIDEVHLTVELTQLTPEEIDFLDGVGYTVEYYINKRKALTAWFFLFAEYYQLANADVYNF